jgi:hypothetical protein
VVEIRELRELARRVAHEREREVLAGEAAAVVGHADRRETTVLELDAQARRARVERVLDELLDDGERPFDDLARGDLRDHLGRQHADPSAALRPGLRHLGLPCVLAHDRLRALPPRRPPP